jgi:hypothetical protein
MCAAKSNAHQERSRRDRKRKKCSKGLDNYGHIEGLLTCDDQMLRVARRVRVEVQIQNPVSYIEEVTDA